MALPAGTKLGSYEIQSPLGAGGMGEVYRARDLRLNRIVAIKILPVHLAEQSGARERFDREARAISSLSHPHICQLYDVGSQDGLQYLVMEYLEGETLANRLVRGPLPTEQLLKYGGEICEGLESAHAKGVVHRDLKPGNIMLTKSGAKLMDFGLAKSATAGKVLNGTSATVTASPGRHPLTADGTVLGTFQYMSPEQAEGKEADTRSDIFALGAVLYEMATGQRAFDGKTPASVMAAVLERDPQPISQLQPASPAALDRIVKTCLAKDPDERWLSVHDVKLQLAGLREDQRSPQAAGVARPGTGRWIAWPLALVLTAALAWWVSAHLRKPVPAVQTIRSSLLPPENWSFLVNSAALSPDGRQLAFVAVGPDGDTSLWVRSLGTGTDRQLTGTAGATLPFWSPDNGRVGFFADSKLKITDANRDNLPKTLADATFGRGGTWNQQGTIVYAPDMFGCLYRISENGGPATAITKLPREGSGQAQRWPFFLPDGKHFLFSIDWSAPGESPGNGIYVGSLDGENPRLITAEVTGNAAFASGQILYARNLVLMAQPFDPDRLQVTGPVVTAWPQPVARHDSFSNSAFAVSQNGVLVFTAVADLKSQLVWFNAKGERLGQIPAVGPSDPRISPDGRFVVFPSDEAGDGKRYLHSYDLQRDVQTRLTDGGTEESPVWSPDSKKVAYFSRDQAAYGLYQLELGSSGSPEVLWKGAPARQPDYGQNVILFGEFSNGRPRLMALSLANRQTTLLHSGAEPRLSPDGRWLVYTLSTGHPFHPEVMVEPYPGPGGRIQISREGGAQGTWSRDGKQIFFIAHDKKMMVVDFDAVRQTVSAPRVVFQTRIVAPNYVTRQYDIDPAGRFLINSLPAGSAPPLTLLTNWSGQNNR